MNGAFLLSEFNVKTCGEDKRFSNIVPLLRVQNLPSPGKFTKNTYSISLKFYIRRDFLLIRLIYIVTP